MTITPAFPQPMPSHPRRRDGRVPLPAAEERARLRRAWQLTERQMAEAFGVTAATVRSWESGRTTPTGQRRAAYAAFLSGLALGLAPVRPQPSLVRPQPTPVRPPSPPVRPQVTPVGPHLPQARPQVTPERPQAIPPLRRPTPVLAGRAAPVAGLPVGGGPDPVPYVRRRRLRAMAVAAAAWAAFVHVAITSPPPHL